MAVALRSVTEELRLERGGEIASGVAHQGSPRSVRGRSGGGRGPRVGLTPEAGDFLVV